MDTILIAFIACFVGSVAFYSVLSPRDATIASYLVFYLLLPPVSVNVPGLPDLTKTSVIALSCWLGTILFASDRLLAFRPRWFDIPAILYTISPFPSSLSNDLSIYDALTGCLGSFLQHSGSPYFLARIHFRSPKDLRALALAIFVGGLVYILPCLLEIRLSPIIRSKVYGIDAGNSFRLGGYRPIVFLANGLELGMWMTSACVAGYALWASRSVAQIRKIPISWLLACLIVVTILCRSTGALVLMGVGLCAVFLTLRIPVKAWILALVLTPPIFEAGRITDLLPVEEVSRLVAEHVDLDRSRSFQFRVDNEDLYIAKAMVRPVFGWGGYNRHQIYDANGRVTTINDSKWIIALGVYGIFGLVTWNAILTIPAVLLVSRIPAREWIRSEWAPATALVLVAILFELDGLVNDMDNPIYSLGVGAVVSVLGAFRWNSARAHDIKPALMTSVESDHPLPETEIEHRLRLGWLESRLGQAADDPSRRVDLARGFESFARYLAVRGRMTDAEEVWNRSIALWDDLATRHPSEPAILHHAAEARNDLAWLLSSRPEATIGEVARAIAWVRDALRMEPDSDGFLNTLAVAYYRSGAWSSVLRVLGDSRDRFTDPSLVGHNCLLRALAYHHLGNPSQARVWRDRARIAFAQGSESAVSRQLSDEADRLIANAGVPQIALPRPGATRNDDKIDTTRQADSSS